MTAGGRYLALGDSVAFGYRDSKATPKPNYHKPKTFIGWTGDVAEDLGLRLTDAACPGETSGSFINPKAASNGCENDYDTMTHKQVKGGYRTTYPLHVKYHGSQLAFAESFLKHHRKTELVTLQIGANDGRLCQQKTTDGCESELTATLAKIQKNVKRILSGIRDKAHYSGQLVLMNYFPIDTDPFVQIGTQMIGSDEKQAAKGFDVEYADAYTAFSDADAQTGGDPCADGLLNVLRGTSPATCGIHPSESGYALLAHVVEKRLKK